MRALAAAALALAASGCSATVALAPQSPAAPAANTSDSVDGKQLPAIEGRILGSDGHHIIVERCNDGRAVTVPRQSIRDIDHPGNVLGGVGVALAFIGAVLLPVSFYRGGACPEQRGDCIITEDFSPVAVPAVTLLAVGVPTAISGLVIWKVSKAAAKD